MTGSRRLERFVPQAPSACAPMLVAVLALLLLSACAGVHQPDPAPRISAPLLAPSMLEGHGLALLTPTGGIAHSEDRQALALVFAEKFAAMRPEVRLVPLAQTLSAVNRAGLTPSYQKMYETYAATGVMDREVLARLRGVCGARYFGMLQLAEFRRAPEGSSIQLSVGQRPGDGMRIRVFLQVWDSIDGTIAWEGLNEFSHPATNGNDSTFSTIMERVAGTLIARMP
jgi:hypothetical protein